MSVAYHLSSHSDYSNVGALSIDEESREVHLDGELIELTRTEFDLMSIFCSNPRRVLTPEMLLAHIWNSEWVPNSHPLEVYIHRLRSKLGESGRYPRFIHNIRGVGYRFEPGPRRDKHHALLKYDSRAVLRSIETKEATVWGWDPDQLIGRQFDPMRLSILGSVNFVNSLNGVFIAPGIEDLKLSRTVTCQDGVVIRLHVHMQFQYLEAHLTGIDVDVTWFDHDRADIKSVS